MSAFSTMESPSDHLLRMLAAVPVSSSILDLGCGQGRHTEALLRLGFPVHACDPRPDAVRATQARVRDLVDDETAQTCVQERSLDDLDDVDATFNWVVVDRAEVFVQSKDELQTLLGKGARLLSPGGWLYLTVPVGAEGTSSSADSPTQEDGALWTGSDLEASRFDVDLVVSRSPSRFDENGTPRLRVLYRHVTGETPV